MLINSVIFVLREVLEAAMIISVLLALAVNLRETLRWLLVALPITAATTVLFAATLDTMTDAFDGAGQEVISASLQIVVFLCTAGIVYCAQKQRYGVATITRMLPVLMALACVSALTREASEILIYIIGFAASEDHRTAIFAGSAVGTGIGVSLGVLLYAALRAMPPERSFSFCYLLLALIGAGMVMQSTMLLEQVDWLPVGRPLWDSSALISEQSLTGQLLYAVFGYEATPGPIQGWLYLACILAVTVAWALGQYAGREHYGP